MSNTYSRTHPTTGLSTQLRPCIRIVLSIFPLTFVILISGIFFTTTQSISASTKTNKQLLDALEILSTLQNANTKAKQAYQEITTQLPAAITDAVQRSSWIKAQKSMTPKMLEKAATTPGTQLIQTPNGLVAISHSKLNSAISGISEFIITNPNAKSIIDSLKPKIPQRFHGAINLLTSYLAKNGAKAPNMAGLKKSLIEALITREVSNYLDPLTENLRDQILHHGAKETLRKASAKVDRSPANTGPSSAQSKRQTANPSQDTLIHEAKLTLATNLKILEKLLATATRSYKECETLAADIPTKHPDIPSAKANLDRRRIARNLEKASIEQSNNLLGGISRIMTLISFTKESAGKLCSSKTTSQEAQKQITSLKKIAEGAYRSTKTQINATKATLQRGIPQYNKTLEGNILSLERKCQPVNNFSIHFSPGRALNAFVQVSNSISRLDRYGRKLDVEVELYKIQFAQLQSRMKKLSSNKCKSRIAAFRKTCDRLRESNLSNLIKQDKSETTLLSRKHHTLQKSVDSIATQLESEYKKAQTAFQSASNCVTRSGIQNIDKAKDALSACRFKESHSLIAALPKNPQREALVKRWNEAYQQEKKARSLVREAIALQKDGQLASAIKSLKQARANTLCDGTLNALNSAIAKISSEQSSNAKMDATSADSAIAACQFKRSRDLIAALPKGIERTKLVQRWNETYKRERQARDLIRKAIVLRSDGKPGRAIGELHRAQDLTRCPTTEAAIDKAIGSIRKETAKISAVRQREAADKKCKSKYGYSYRAGTTIGNGAFSCIPDQRTANQICRSQNQGTGWYANRIRENGTIDCQQSRAGANAACRARNGSGWRAGQQLPNGAFACVPGPAARTAQCVRLNGAGYRAGRLRRQGTRHVWSCIPPRRVVAPRQPRRPVSRPTRCPAGYVRMDNGSCVNMGPIGGALRGAAKNLGPGGAGYRLSR